VRQQRQNRISVNAAAERGGMSQRFGLAHGQSNPGLQG
jgi:hypothetical protein